MKEGQVISRAGIFQQNLRRGLEELIIQHPPVIEPPSEEDRLDELANWYVGLKRALKKVAWQAHAEDGSEGHTLLPPTWTMEVAPNCKGGLCLFATGDSYKFGRFKSRIFITELWSPGPKIQKWDCPDEVHEDRFLLAIYRIKQMIEEFNAE